MSVNRKLLAMSISSLLLEIGYESADNQALETLVEILQSFIREVGIGCRMYAEVAGRTETLVGDVILTLTNMGVNPNGIEMHARRSNPTVLPAPTTSSQPKQLSILQAGIKKDHPMHIPTNLPSFPDPHAYIRTPTHKQPVTEYEAIREKAACQKRDLERALVKFIAKTGETDSLFLTADNVFPLVACKPQLPPYTVAIIPKDQVFEADEEDSRSPQRKKGKDVKEDEEEGVKGESDIIDNPYLRPVKLPPNKIKIKGFAPVGT